MYKYDLLVILLYTHIICSHVFSSAKGNLLKRYCMNLIGISPHPRFLVLIKLKFQTSQGKNGNQQICYKIQSRIPFLMIHVLYLYNTNISEENFLMEDVCNFFLLRLQWYCYKSPFFVEMLK